MGRHSVSAEGQMVRSARSYTASASRRLGPRPKNGAPTLCSLSAANKSADITLDQSMAYVEKLGSRHRKWRFWPTKKAPFSAIFPLCIQGAGQRGPGAMKESVRQPIGPEKFAIQQTAFPGEDGRMPHRDAQQIRDDRFTRSSPTFHRARASPPGHHDEPGGCR